MSWLHVSGNVPDVQGIIDARDVDALAIVGDDDLGDSTQWTVVQPHIHARRLGIERVPDQLRDTYMRVTPRDLLQVIGRYVYMAASGLSRSGHAATLQCESVAYPARRDVVRVGTRRGFDIGPSRLTMAQVSALMSR